MYTYTSALAVTAVAATFLFSLSSAFLPHNVRLSPQGCRRSLSVGADSTVRSHAAAALQHASSHRNVASNAVQWRRALTSRASTAAAVTAGGEAAAPALADANQLDLFGEFIKAINGTDAEMLAAAEAIKDRVREPFFVIACACIHAQYPDDTTPALWEQRDNLFKLMGTLHRGAGVPTPSPVALLLCQLVQTDNIMERNKSLFAGLRFLEHGCGSENAMLEVADLAEDVEKECKAAKNDNPLSQYPEVLEDMFMWFESNFQIEYNE